jgi:dTMP kinase
MSDRLPDASSVPAPPGTVIPPSLAGRGAYRRLMSNRGFRNMWIGQTISGVGDWLVIGLLIPLVTTLAPGSSMAVAGIVIAKLIPSLLIGSALGALVDRFDRRRLMIACDLINGVLCLGLVTATAAHALPAGLALAAIYGIIFLMEICNLLFVPAKNALIPMIVEEGDLAAANGLSYTTQQVSMIIGLVASGAIVSVFAAFLKLMIAAKVAFISAIVAAQPGLIGPQGGIVLDFVSFMVSATLISTIHVARCERAERGFDLRLIGRDAIEAYQLLRAEKDLRGLLVSMGLALLGGGAIVSVGLVYVQQNLVGGIPFLDLVPPIQRVAAQGPQMFMLVFLALGTFVGAVVVPRIAARVTLQQLFVTAVGGFGVAMLFFSSVSIYWVAGLFAVAAGFLLAQATVAGNTFVAQTVADSARGRIFAAVESVTRAALLVSMIVIAPIGDLVGGLVRQVVVASGGGDQSMWLTGSRITLIFASLIVLGAAVYGTITIDWRTKRANGRPADA